MTKPRPYQITALDRLYDDLQSEQNVLLKAVMSAGKTFIAVKLIERLYREKPKSNYLIMMHKGLLVEQFIESFDKFTNIKKEDIGVCWAGGKRRETDKRIIIATVQTAFRLKDKFRKISLFTIDEIHRADMTDRSSRYAQILAAVRDNAPNSRLLGITATVSRLSHGMIWGNQCRPDRKNIFKKINHAISYSELLSLGYIAPLMGKVAQHENMSSDLAGIRINGDYVLNQLGEIMSREYHIETCVDAILEHCSNYNKVSVLACTIDHAEKILIEMVKAGLNATIVHSKLTPLEKSGNMECWRNGNTKYMVSCEMLAEGFDFKELDCLVMARPTLSPVFYLQAVGRVLRISENKDHGFLLDITDNTKRFGTDLDNVRITIPKAAEEIVKKEQELIKICPACQAEVSIYRRDCDCGYEWTAEEIQIATAVPELTDVTFEKEPPLVVKCNYAEPSIHESRKTKKQLGKLDITYGESYQSVSVYFCLDDYYSGYAVTMSRKRWQDVSKSTFPTTVDEFMTCDFILPESLELDLNGKFPDIVKINMGTESVSNYSDEVPF